MAGLAERDLEPPGEVADAFVEEVEWDLAEWEDEEDAFDTLRARCTARLGPAIAINEGERLRWLSERKLRDGGPAAIPTEVSMARREEYMTLVGKWTNVREACEIII